MSKKCKLMVVIFSLLLFPGISTATSGACSSHGGVNCKVVSALDDSAICNDGWLSTTKYSDTEECKQVASQSYCFPPVGSGCKTESDLGIVQRQSYTSGESRYSPDMSQGNIQACRDQIISYQAKVLSYQTCLSSEQSNTVRKPSPVFASVGDYCKYKYGTNSNESIEKTGSCICEVGYEFDSNDKCSLRPSIVPKVVDSCKKTFGVYSMASTTNGSYCTCQKGYYFSTSTDRQCVPIDNYYCGLFFDSNYIPDTDGKNCVLKPVKQVQLPKTNTVMIKTAKSSQIIKVVSTSTESVVLRGVATSAELVTVGTTTKSIQPKPSFFKRLWNYIWKF